MKTYQIAWIGVGLATLIAPIQSKLGTRGSIAAQTAAASTGTAVFRSSEIGLFAPSVRAASNGAIEEIIALKASGQRDQIEELYRDMAPDPRAPGDVLDQGGETFATATVVPALPYNDAGTTAGAVHNYDTNFGGCPASTAPDVVYRYDAPFAQSLVAELCGSSYDTKLMVYQNNSSTPIACNDDACDLSSQVSFAAVGGNAYYIVVDGYNASSFGPYMIRILEDEPCDVIPPLSAVSECAFETVGPIHSKKDCNGGCNNETVDGQYDFDRFDGICSGTTVRGKCFTYIGDDNGNYRDTDWFLFKMSVTGPVQLLAQAEFPALVGIINLDNCVAPSFIQSTTATPCSPANVNVPTLSPGTYAAFVAPSSFTGVETQREYVLQVIYPTLPPVCACPNPEQEPNDDVARATPIPGPGITMCGEISCPMDGDFYVIQLPHPSALRVHLRGNAAAGSCPGGQGLHPYCEIISEDGRVMALCGDVTNQATWFDSDFKFGPYRYYFHVGGADYSTGPYEIEIELLQLNLVSCNPITVTIAPENNGVRLRWQGGLLPTDIVRIEYRTDTNAPFQLLADVPSVPWDFFDPGSQPFDFREYQVRVIGGREPELTLPWVGSKIGLGESTGPNGEYDEIGEYAVQQIEWAAGPDNIAIQTLLVAQGVGSEAGVSIVQDRRDLYNAGYAPISSFSGHWLQVDERKVFVEHVAFGRNQVHGDVGVIDGRGWNETMDTLMFFGNEKVMLEPNNGGVAMLANIWLWWFWWEEFFCPDVCCRLKTIAFCTATGAVAPPGCVSGPLTPCPCNPACWLGCPCDPPVPPDPAFCCPPVGPPSPPTYPTGCSGCTFVMSPTSPLIRYCQCASEASPPTTGRCFFVIFIKCKEYCDCPEIFFDCGCAATPCPGPATWTLVPFVTSAMRAACQTDCIIGGPGC